MSPYRSLVWSVALLTATVSAASCEEPAPSGSTGDPPSTSSSGFSYPTTGGSVACSDPEGGAPPIACDPQYPPVSFSGEVTMALGGCARELCHDPIERDALVGAPSSQCSERVLVEPGRPEASYLIAKLRGERLCCGERMPPDEAPLSEPALALITAWVCQGAPE